MDILSFNALASYWSAALVATNILIFFNILGALLLGLLVGYERAYNGHAAGIAVTGPQLGAFDRSDEFATHRFLGLYRLGCRPWA
jgi:hypothetical protein